jgi:L-alanine-DL-glutamate epimerase-like enolase superfamily enzyme
MAASGATIERIDAWYVRVPLATPIVLGSLHIVHRDFVVVRVRTRDGVDGSAYSLTRGSPLDQVLIDSVAPHLLGRDALATAARLEDMQRGVITLGPVGLVGRAISLLEICLWDIKGKVAGLPVHRLLGGSRDAAPMLAVAPYAANDEADEAYAERLIPLAQRGYQALKLYPMARPEAMTRRLAAIRRAVGDEIGLVIDMAWSFRTAPEAIAAVQQWEDFHLTWVEDPFPSWEPVLMRQLAEGVRTPIAAGDEVSVPAVMETLIRDRAVDVVRLDATSIGGYARFGELAATARRAGYQVSHHAYAEIQQHCVFAWPGVSPVEIFVPGSPTWGTSRFLTEELDLPAGQHELPAPTRPGVGIPFDWAAVEALASRHPSVDATEGGR